jgi:hypothetical protein
VSIDVRNWTLSLLLPHRGTLHDALVAAGVEFLSNYSVRLRMGGR